jgi:transposase-like protein
VRVISQAERKYGRLVRELAVELILREPGRQLPTVSELARRFDVGHGTVQRALRTLEASGAVRLEARGHLGTYVLEKDVRRLWEAAGIPGLLGGFPLPVRRPIQGLAATVQAGMRGVGVPVEVAYVEGSRRRLGQLRLGRLDFVLVSRFAAERAWENQRDVVIVRNFGPGTYCDPASLKIGYRRFPPERIAVDWRSCEHYWRTVEAFPGAEGRFVRMPYLEIPSALERGDVDAGLWFSDTMWQLPQGEGIVFEEVRPSLMDRAMSEACLVVLSDNHLVRGLIERALGTGEISEE